MMINNLGVFASQSAAPGLLYRLYVIGSRIGAAHQRRPVIGNRLNHLSTEIRSGLSSAMACGPGTRTPETDPGGPFMTNPMGTGANSESCSIAGFPLRARALLLNSLSEIVHIFINLRELGDGVEKRDMQVPSARCLCPLLAKIRYQQLQSPDLTGPVIPRSSVPNPSEKNTPSVYLTWESGVGISGNVSDISTEYSWPNPQANWEEEHDSDAIFIESYANDKAVAVIGESNIGHVNTGPKCKDVLLVLYSLTILIGAFNWFDLVFPVWLDRDPALDLALILVLRDWARNIAGKINDDGTFLNLLNDIPCCHSAHFSSERRRQWRAY
ncbi:uncharacterized protein BDR25DRAFT_353596 [Lindgomyces ingoldianus]|uniref:Uncharacterized protein n=1 Tax=Lindgomyces ingoldianus TaxID=673940 RepID=A0ACB6R077_9PLEO|nr:uncharacterized protein BDR25DRAFT_353596 [Lindgomyces ingoldianus]KAF2472556.1 hypothetical protein BDR25DRAFT_353596 [Lindgomyces ingoldianus]